MPVPAIEVLNFYLGASCADVVPGLEPVSGDSYSPPSGPQSRCGRTDQPAQPLRRTFATITLDNGVALHDLQDGLEQADPRTTRRYDRSRHKLAKSAGYDVARALA